VNTIISKDGTPIVPVEDSARKEERVELASCMTMTLSLPNR
jgi:hypothetical protein